MLLCKGQKDYPCTENVYGYFAESGSEADERLNQERIVMKKRYVLNGLDGASHFDAPPDKLRLIKSQKSHKVPPKIPVPDSCKPNASRFPKTKEADHIGQPLFDYRNVMPSMT